ncbi:MAG: ATP-grasp domain-containing protein [Desulfobacteraceae bacterium]|nr:ATP-grasp domain-containing protein [Desulfobacteraceae bacterium]
MNLFFPAGGRRVELINFFKKEVKVLGGKIVVGDIVNTSPALYIADKAYLLPSFNSEECYEVFKNIYKNEKIDLVIPLLDYELDYYSANYIRMQSDGINVMISSPQNIEIFRNKKKTNETFRRLGIPTPVQWNLESAEKEFPVIIKPIKGSAGKQIHIASDQAELEMIINQIGNKKFVEKFIIEELVEGEEVTSDALIDLEDNIRAISQRERIKVRGGEVERSKIVDYKDIKKYIELLFSSIKVIGVLNIQCFLSKDGPIFTEINARFGGGYPLSYHAGCDFPKAIINMYNNKPIQKMNVKIGYHMLRYDNAIYLDENELIK